MPPAPYVREADQLPEHERAPVLQWIGVFLAPAAFFAHLQLNYVVVPWSCTTHQRFWVHVISLVAVVLAVGGTWAAVRVHARTRNGTAAESIPRTRFLGLVGVLMSGVFSLLLVAQLVAGLVISPCQ